MRAPPGVFGRAICLGSGLETISLAEAGSWQIACGKSRIQHLILVSNTSYMEAGFGIRDATLRTGLWNIVDLFLP